MLKLETPPRTTRQSVGTDGSIPRRIAGTSAPPPALDAAAVAEAGTGGPFPFCAIVGQDDMCQALLIAAVDPSVGGVLILGDRGTGKSTGVRALSALLPLIDVVAGCPCGCAPESLDPCFHCAAKKAAGHLLENRRAVVPMVDLPLGVTEDRILGSLDLERALSDGVKAYLPGLLARANRGFLYIDEVNLLEDHLVDLLIDVAASGVNIFERDGLSVRHPARVVLVGSGNPEEGELRPQLLDRFGLSVEVRTPTDIATRVEIVKRRDRYERDPREFRRQWAEAERAMRERIAAARAGVGEVVAPDTVIASAARLCVAVGSDGSRGELTLIRAARAVAALDRCTEVGLEHLRKVAAMALGHRMRRSPLDEAGSTVRIARAVAEHLSS